MTFDYAALEAAGIEQVTIDYHGAGDEGYIEEIEVIPNVDMDHSLFGLRGQIETAANDLLYDQFPGWELDTGSSGTITVHVQARKADIHHGHRTEATTYEDREIS